MRCANRTWFAAGAFALALIASTLTTRGQRRSAATRGARFAGGGNAAEVPMELAANVVFVPVQVGGGNPSNWMLDTASPRTAADSSAFASQAEGTGDNSGSPAALSLPGVQFIEPNLIVRDFQALGPWYGLRVTGVVGDDLLAGLVAELDYSRLSIELYRPRSYRQRGPMEKIPVRWVSGIPAIRVKLRLGGRTVEGDFALNTGSSSGIVVFRPFLSAQPILPHVGKTIPGDVVDVSGVRAATLMRGEWADLGSIRVPRPIVSIVQQDEPSSGAAFERFKGTALAGWIGGGILRKFRLVLDFPENCIFAAPGHDFVFPIEADTSGATITAAGADLRQFEVRNVREGSPAAQAGLQPGDRIVLIDGEDASSFSLDQIRDLLRQANRSPVLIVERMDRRVRIDLQLKQTL